MQILKIRFLQSAAGKDTTFKKGEIYSLPFNQAESFLYAKIAIPVTETRETATIKVKETRDVQNSNTGSSNPNKPRRSKTSTKGKRN